MSESKAREDRKVKLMTEEAGNQKVAEEMAESIRKMYEDRDAKVSGAKEHLVSQLEVTADKYRTANGVMSALDTVRLVMGNSSHASLMDELSLAKAAANRMAMTALEMSRKAADLDPEYLYNLCNGFYDPAFSEGDGEIRDMVDQLMLLQLCQNVGPSSQDVTDFLRTANEEIEKAKAELRKHCEDNDVNFDGLNIPE